MTADLYLAPNDKNLRKPDKYRIASIRTVVNQLEEIDMTQENGQDESSVLYWIMLGVMFVAFATVAVS